jgi:hypothetical protein
MVREGRTMKRLTIKLGSMRKAKDWVVYPRETGESKLVLQCDDRIALIDPDTRKGVLSKSCRNPGFMMLSTALGATPIEVPDEVVAQALTLQPRGGDEIGPGVYVAPEEEPLDVLAQIKKDIGSEHVAECPEFPEPPDELTEITDKIHETT